MTDTIGPTPTAPLPVFSREAEPTKAAAIAGAIEALEALKDHNSIPRLPPPPATRAYVNHLPVSADLRARLQLAVDAGYVLPSHSFTTANGELGVRFPASDLRADAGGGELSRRIRFTARRGLPDRDAPRRWGVFRRPGRSEQPAADKGPFTPQDRTELAAALPSETELAVTLSSEDISNVPRANTYERIAYLAHRLISQLLATRAWNSPYLDTAHSTFDPARELAEITEHASRLAYFYSQICPPLTGAGAEAVTARHHQDYQRGQLDVLTHSLIERVAALQHYVTLLDELSERITALDQLERLTTVGGELDALFTQYGADELAKDNYRRLIDDVEATRAGIEAVTEILSGPANTP